MEKTETYEKMCISRNVQCARLLDIGESFLRDIHELEETSRKAVARIEYATVGDIHRGVYCPSPILEVVLGNTHRGRLLKRIADSSCISHRFYFNSENRLLFCEFLSEGKTVNTEYIIEQTDFHYGITINADYELDAISEEQHSNQKLFRYSYLDVYPDIDDYFCANLHTEQYAYDELGLITCEVVYALMEANGCTKQKLTEIYQRKHNARGGFSERIFLIGNAKNDQKT